MASTSTAIDRQKGRTDTPDGPPPAPVTGGRGGLERVTVNLTAKSLRALERLSELTGESKTEAINRALQLYAFLEEFQADEGVVFLREAGKNDLQRLRMF